MLGGGDGQLAWEIARQSKFFVVIFETDAAKAAAQRDKLVQAGVYGRRVVVRHETGQTPPAYPFGFANLVVSDEALSTGKVPYDPEAILPLVQPYGGAVVFGTRRGPVDVSGWTDGQFSVWQPVGTGQSISVVGRALLPVNTTMGRSARPTNATVNSRPILAGSSAVRWMATRRGPLPGAGQWTHTTGDPANTMCSGETRVPCAGGDLMLQWFGAPYAQDVVDRHRVPTPPLYSNGIMFVSGRGNNLAAFDAYNGTRLWKIDLPDSLRMLASHNAGPVACSADGRHVFVYHRDYGHSVFDLSGWQKFRLTGATRPSCWPSTLPVGGMVLAPEASAACSCGLSYQMSFALAPKVSRSVSCQD